MEIRKFSWDEIGVEAIYKVKSVQMHYPFKHKKKLTDNIENYSHWVIRMIQEVTGHTPEHGQQYNACSIHMNKANIEFLHRCFVPMDWLNLSPKELDSLADDEFAVNVKEAFTNVSRD